MKAAYLSIKSAKSTLCAVNQNKSAAFETRGTFIDPGVSCGFERNGTPSLIARFMGPTGGLPGDDRSQVGPMWAI